MKTKLLTISLLLSASMMFLISNEKTNFIASEKENVSNSFVSLEKEVILPNKPHREVIEVALAQVKNIDELRADLKVLSDKEITDRLKETQKELELQGLIQKANLSELDEKTALKLVQLMRANEALYSISLDRKMSKFERKYL